MRKIKKRKKSSRSSSRYRGKGTKKSRGKGNVGGKGMSGSGKRGDQKKTYITKYKHPYFGSAGKRGKIDKRKRVNIGDIAKNLEGYSKGEGKGGIKIELKDHKILGKGDLDKKLIVTAKSFSKEAKKKIEAAGGKAIESKSESKKK